jgi:hypothetical protein
MLGAMLMLAAIFKPPGRRTQATDAGNRRRQQTQARLAQLRFGARRLARAFGAVSPAAGPAYNWPYRRSTSRQLFPTRKLWATSVALQRIILLQVMPALRSQNLSAAGRQGARSCMSMAAAKVVETPRKRQMAMTIFMPRRAPPFWPTNLAGE